MKFRYLPMTEENRDEMLKEIGVSSVDELFSDIPESVLFKGNLNIKEALSEQELIKEFNTLANKNINMKTAPSFLGAGVYDHYIPSIVDHVISRSEFYTAYTPYQPEISQGELQAIFEFQTMICELTGMDVANSSMYDGATALAEAATLSAGEFKGKRKKILVSDAVHPESIEVLKSYALGQHLEVEKINLANGVTDLKNLSEKLDDTVACVIVQYPNFFGQVEPLKEIEKQVHANNSHFVVSSNPLALGVLTPPGAFGADFTVGDAQVFGIAPQFGGPHCGFFAANKKFMRKMPGRLVGQTVDEDGKRGFVLTLQAREQHIRREKATSNICSNQALNALAAAVAMTAIGKQGIKEMAIQNISKSQYAKKQFVMQGYEVALNGPFFNEFVITVKSSVTNVNEKLLQKGFIGGFDLEKVNPLYSNQMLIAVTEKRTKEEIDAFVREVANCDN